MSTAAPNHMAWCNKLDSLLQCVIGFLLLAMVALNVLNAIGRYLFGQSLAGADEIMVFGMVWLVFLGMPLIAAKGEHLGFGWLGQRLPIGPSRLLSGVLDFYVCALCIWLTLQSADFVERIAMLNQKSMAVGIPMVIPHAAITFAMAATSIVCGWRGVRSIAMFIQNDSRGSA